MFEWRKFIETRKRVVLNQLQREVLLVAELWPYLVIGGMIQYVHSIFHNLVYYLYDFYGVGDQPLLVDLIFEIGFLSEEKWGWTSELITFGILAGTVIWCLSPFIVEKRGFYATFVLRRYLVVMSIAFVIRIVSFLITILPSPGPQCRSDSPLYNPPTTAVDILFRIDALEGCADLVFSSHTAYTVTSSLLYWKYGSRLGMKILLSSAVIVVGILISLLRKHYSVDVWLAWTIIPLIWFNLETRMMDTIPEPLMEFEKSIDSELHRDSDDLEDPNIDENSRDMGRRLSDPLDNSSNVLLFRKQEKA